jgi:hypothetical protein
MKDVSNPMTLFALTSVGILGLTAVGLTGCDALKNIVGEIAPPGAEFMGVDLVAHPSAREMARWGCFEYFTKTACDFAGLNNVKDSDMLFSFDIAFDLSNNNEKIPIPLVEILLATSVYDGDDLGAVCISFCNPDNEDCEPTSNAEDACDAEGAEDVNSAADIVPTLDELQDIAKSVASGDFDNGEFRTIPAQDNVEAHIQFDFNIDTMLELSENVLTDLGLDILNGRSLSVSIPYEMDGSLFFNIPEMGRHAIGFGPIDGKWKF